MPISKKKIGILGGGQLARMLALKGIQMGSEIHIFCEKKDDPAVHTGGKIFYGKLSSEKDIKKFIQKVDIITFESEFIPALLLKRCLKGVNSKKLYPSLKSLGRLQDRLMQKEWLLDFELPTLEHVKINSKDDIQLAFDAFNQQIVFKSRIGGYDGYGTFIIKNQHDLDLFKIQIKGEESQFIIEPFKNFKSERSLIFARNTLGQITQLPMVTSVQKNNQCDYVFGPTEHSQTTKIVQKIKYFLNQIEYVGVIAFELFDLGQQLVINEIAPRVHNTGHFSQQALAIDQFELHLRCLLGFTLPEPQLIQPEFVMVNLLGNSQRTPKIKKFPSGVLHWYDKTENRPKRKLGHINYIGRNNKELLEIALKERKNIIL